jgi:hypothetical protein
MWKEAFVACDSARPVYGTPVILCHVLKQQERLLRFLRHAAQYTFFLIHKIPCISQFYLFRS